MGPGRSGYALAGLFAVSVFGGISGTVPAPAFAGWSPTVVLGSLRFGPLFGQPYVAINAEGDAVVAWTQGYAEHEDLRVTVRRHGSSWERPSSVGSGHSMVEEPRVAMDRQGTATIAWCVCTHAAHKMDAASRRRRGRWGRPVLLTPDSFEGDSTQLALDAQGHPVVLMRDTTHGGEALLASTRASDGRWRGPRVVARGFFGSGEPPQFAISAHGEGIIAWRDSSGNEERVSVLVLGADGRPERPVQALRRAVPRHRGCSLHGVQLATDARGDAVLAWGDQALGLTPRNCGPVEVATRRARARFSRPGPLYGASGASVSPAVAIDTSGTASVLFSGEPKTGPSAIEAASHPLNGHWTSARLSPPGLSTGEARIAVDGHGGLLAIWNTTVPRDATTPEHMAIEASARPAGMPWQQPSRISPPRVNGGDLDLAVARNGRATVVWVNKGDALLSQPSFIESADYVP